MLSHYPPAFYCQTTQVFFLLETAMSNYVWQPHNTKWLSPAERRLAQVRLAEDAGEADEDSKEDS